MKARGPDLLVTAMFAGLLLSSGAIQLSIELENGRTPQVVELFTRKPTVANLRAYEDRLEDESWVAAQLRPWMQYACFILLEDAGQKALLGRNGWWFYQAGVEYVTQQQPARIETEDPLPAIRDYRDRLAGRGIHLMVVPVPNKESVYPEELSRRAEQLPRVVSRQTQSLIERLQAAGVEVVDLFEVYHQAKSTSAAGPTDALYLAQDTHWSPAGLELAARVVAQRLLERGWIERGHTPYDERSVRLQRLGDLVRMLDVPPLERRLPPEAIRCTQIVRLDSGEVYSDDPAAGVLVLGDSFLRIFQQEEPGGAGFIAHLAHQLRQPVASVVNDGGAATLVRQELHRRPALLEHKQVVVWEFVERDIRFGTEGWSIVPLPGEGPTSNRPSRP